MQGVEWNRESRGQDYTERETARRMSLILITLAKRARMKSVVEKEAMVTELGEIETERERGREMEKWLVFSVTVTL